MTVAGTQLKPLAEEAKPAKKEEKEKEEHKAKEEDDCRAWTTPNTYIFTIHILISQVPEGRRRGLVCDQQPFVRFIQRLDHFRRYSFGSFGIYRDEPSLEIQEVLMWRGQELATLVSSTMAAQEWILPMQSTGLWWRSTGAMCGLSFSS